MTDFKNKLSALLNENTDHMVFMDEPIYADIDEDTITSELSAAGPLYGLKYLGYSEGVLSFSTYQKSAIERFAMFLDDNEYADHYAISVIESSPLTKATHVLDSVDFDSLRESEFLEFFIDVVINWRFVTYNDVYVDPADPFGLNQVTAFNIPLATGTGEYPSDFDDSTEFYQKEKLPNDPQIDITPGFDAVSSNEVPLLVKLSTVKSNVPDGSILVTVHPQNEDEVLIQAAYKSEPHADSVMRDLDLINNFEDEYGDRLELKTPAVYTLGSLATTSAVYTSINKRNVLNIVEMFAKDAAEMECDVNLLNEITRKVKVNFRGKKRIKMQCQPGFKYDPERMTCVKISGAEMATSRIAHRQMARTKKALGDSYRTRILRKVRRAKRFRKMMGIKDD